MDNTLQLIDELIAEHKTVPEKTSSLEKAANDVRLLSALKDAGDTIVRGEILQDADLKELAQMVDFIASWLEKHFAREETALRPAPIQHTTGPEASRRSTGIRCCGSPTAPRCSR